MDKTLLKGLAVLEAVAGNDGPPRTIDELAAQLQLTRSNVHRTLQTLAHAGYVVRDEMSGNYRSTLRLFELGARQVARFDVRKYAPPFMRLLAEQTGETVHLSVLDGIDVIYLDKIDSPQPIRSYTAIGGRAPAYAVATGKALLAVQPDGYLARYESAIQRHTPATLASLPALKDEMQKITRLGYALNCGEWRESVGGVAVAIFDAMDQPVAALGISGPMERLTPARMEELAPLVRKYAAEVSRAMGYRDGYFRKTA
ncbi:IclR family transcriptional regulator [Massilia niastensis]|uniref:IclR family transcriptional regulator n=1 Tax=Massilia niastensis TaxID=544911 RepID=UPI000477929E|nr:IclR family transcriptional regulator [Massilia niastensis]